MLRRKQKRTKVESKTQIFSVGTRVKVSDISEDIKDFLGSSAEKFYNQTGTILSVAIHDDAYLVEMDNWYPRLMCLSGAMISKLDEA